MAKKITRTRPDTLHNFPCPNVRFSIKNTWVEAVHKEPWNSLTGNGYYNDAIVFVEEAQDGVFLWVTRCQGYYGNCILTQWEQLDFAKINLSSRVPFYLLQPRSFVDGVLKKLNPYVDTANLSNRDICIYLIYPWLEILNKAGYAFAETPFEVFDAPIEFQRLCKKGNSPKEIFKTDKAIYTMLKNVPDLRVWDIFRRLHKRGVAFNDLERLFEKNFDRIMLNKIGAILNRIYNGKPIFSVRSLLNYFDRIDTYEAILPREGVDLISDYLFMCEQLGVEPKIDGDSLKREHDVTARLFANMRNTINEQKMLEACQKLSANNYTEEQYIIRAVKDYGDLADEAKQQHNCVACYGPSIANRKTQIYFLRSAEAPDKSLVTVQLNMRGELLQAYRAYNKPISSEERAFLDRWLQAKFSA